MHSNLLKSRNVMWQRRLQAVMEPLGSPVAACMWRGRHNRVEPLSDSFPEVVTIETQPRHRLRILHWAPEVRKTTESNYNKETQNCSNERQRIPLSKSTPILNADCSALARKSLEELGKTKEIRHRCQRSETFSHTNFKPTNTKPLLDGLTLLAENIADAVVRMALFECLAGFNRKKLSIPLDSLDSRLYSNSVIDFNNASVNGSLEQLVEKDAFPSCNGIINPAFTTSSSDLRPSNESMQYLHSPNSKTVGITEDSFDDDQISYVGSSLCSSTWSSSHAETVRWKRRFLPVKFVEKPVLFFIHGIGSSADVWHAQMTYFRDKGYESIAIDLVGHGFSSAPDDSKSYGFQQVVLDVMNVFDRFCKERNAVIGHSYGASVAAALAHQRPRQVSHLVLVSGGGPVCLAPRSGSISLPTCLVSCIRPLVMCGCQRDMFYAPSGRQAVAPGALDLPRYVLHHIVKGQHWPEGDVAFYKQISVPTLLVHGLKDPFVTLVEECEMEKAIPRAFLELIPDASHMVMLDSPQTLNTMVHRFLKSWDR